MKRWKSIHLPEEPWNKMSQKHSIQKLYWLLHQIGLPHKHELVDISWRGTFGRDKTML